MRAFLVGILIAQLIIFATMIVRSVWQSFDMWFVYVAACLFALSFYGMCYAVNEGHEKKGKADGKD